MNIFYLDESPVLSAQAQTDKHVVKMIVESAQMLSTAHRVLDGKEFIQLSKSGARLKKWDHPEWHETLYKTTHVNHPSNIWLRQSVKNYEWLYSHFVALCDEYTKRYKRIHATETLLKSILLNSPVKIPQEGITPVLLAIKETKWHVVGDPIQSYRNYYEGEKLKSTEEKERYFRVLGIKQKA